MSYAISNIIESFVPIVRPRNYAPTRTFITKWDVEIAKNRTKKMSRNRERDSKYFDANYDVPEMPEVQDDISDDGSEKHYMSDNDYDDEIQWINSVHTENKYYDDKNNKLIGNFEWYDMNSEEFDTCQSAPRKRFLYIGDEEIDTFAKKSRP
jgi:hypothetical protein